MRATPGKDTATSDTITFCTLPPSAAISAMASSDEGTADRPSQIHDKVGVVLEQRDVVGGDVGGGVVLAGLHARNDGRRVGDEVKVDVLGRGGLVARPAVELALGAVGLVVVVAGDVDVLVLHPLGELVGAGADVLGDDARLIQRVQHALGHDGRALAQARHQLVDVGAGLLHLQRHGVGVRRLKGRLADHGLRVARAGQPAAASSAVISWPLWNLTPWRRCQVYSVESSLISQLSASSATGP